MSEDTRLMELLYRIAHTINGSLDLDETLRSILNALQSHLGVRIAAIRLLNRDADALQLAASVGLTDDQIGQVPAQVLPGSVHERVLAGETVHIHDLSQKEQLPPDVPAIAGAAEMLAVPLQLRGRVIGALRLWAGPDFRFTASIITMVRAVADLSAVAIENARLHTSLISIAQALTSSLELKPMLDKVLAATVLEMGLKAASVRLLSSDRTALELVAAYGLSEHYLAKGPVVVARSLLDQRLLTGESVVLYDVAEEPGFQYPEQAQAEGIRSVLAVPLRVRDRVVGVMRVYSSQPRQFTTVGVEFLQSVAGLVAVAVENAKLYEALRARYEDLKVDVSEWYRFLSLG